MAKDGYSPSSFARVSRDVYAMKLGYFTDDYTPIGGTIVTAFQQHNYTSPHH
jgi:hypothetical protein